MKNSVNSNMYEAALVGTWSAFDAYLSGERQGLILVLSFHPLEKKTADALQSSFNRLGYGSAPCTFVTLQPTEKALALSPRELFALVEGLDPICLVVADSACIELLEKAYQCKLPRDARARLFGRESRLFSSFESLISNNPGKQKAWALLKSIPKLAL